MKKPLWPLLLVVLVLGLIFAWVHFTPGSNFSDLQESLNELRAVTPLAEADRYEFERTANRFTGLLDRYEPDFNRRQRAAAEHCRINLSVLRSFQTSADLERHENRYTHAPISDRVKTGLVLFADALGQDLQKLDATLR